MPRAKLFCQEPVPQHRLKVCSCFNNLTVALRRAVSASTKDVSPIDMPDPPLERYELSCLTSGV